jgi:radical SAM superfamily enzyme YgiQ (UPF0313 family)
MAMKKVYLLYRDTAEESFLSLPLLWCSSKTYYEENSTKANEWSWGNPYFGKTESAEEILSTLRQDPPDVVGFSIYVWNEKFFDSVAEQVRAEFPNCWIVYGGFQPSVKHNSNFFKQKPWVNVVVQGSAYGEPAVKELLDVYPNKNFEHIPHLYYPDEHGNVVESAGAFSKKDFRWPNNIFKSQEKYLLDRLNQDRDKKSITAFWQTSRGCPYQCIYCDWGGGVNTKTIKKPFDIIRSELEWLSIVAKVDRVELTDANFGINKSDLDTARLFVELKKTYGWPKILDYEPAKNHTSRVVEIAEMLANVDALTFHRISLQSLDPVVQKNVLRINAPLEDQISGMKHIERVSGGRVPLYIECMLGLPGDTYQAICNQIDTVYGYGVAPGWIHNYGWMLLPESPSYSPTGREVHKLVTVKKWINHNAKLKPGFTVSDNSSLNLLDPFETKSVETVVGTYSYTQDDYIQMFRLTNFCIATHITGVNDYLIRYIVNQHNIKPSEILTKILNFIDSQNFSNNILASKFNLQKTVLQNWMYDEHTASGIDLDPEFPLVLAHHAFFAMSILLHINSFYEEVCNLLSKEYNDECIVDLGNYLKNVIIDYNYTQREFSVEHNWLDYFNNQALVKGNFKYRVDDRLQTTTTSRSERLLEYYKFATGNNLNPEIKIAKRIVSI